MPSSALRLRDLRALHELVHECRDRGDDATAWREHWFTGLGRLCGAGVAIGGLLTGCRAGRPTPGPTIEWGWQNGFNRAGWVHTLGEFRSDPGFSVNMAAYFARGAHLGAEALARTDLLTDAEWYRSDLYEYGHRVCGANESMILVQPVPGAADDFEGLVLLRASGDRDFAGRHRALVREAGAAIRRLIGGPLAQFGEPSPSDLPARAREVLRCLLEGDSDKQAALRLGISRHTVNHYTKVIFDHFRVATRTELLARWVRRGWGNGFAW